MKIIIDGVFEISDETGQKVTAGKGDVFFFPKGAKITFTTEEGGLAWYCGQRGSEFFFFFFFDVLGGGIWRCELTWDRGYGVACELEEEGWDGKEEREWIWEVWLAGLPSRQCVGPSMEGRKCIRW